MNFGIVGASGFVGQKLCAVLADAGHGVVRYSRSGRDGFRKLDPEAVGELDLDGVDVLVNLAGDGIFGRWTGAKWARIWDSRVGLTEGLVRAMANSDVSAFVCASGVGYYGDRGDEELPDGSSLGEGRLAELSAAWEAAAAGAREFGVRVCFARMGMVLGDGGPLAVMRGPFSLGLGGKIGSGRQWMPWVHLDDAAAAILECGVNENLEGPVNMVAPGVVTNAEFTRVFGKALGRPTFIPVPAFGLRAVLGDGAEVALLSQRALPEKLEATGFEFRYPEMGMALAAILDL